MVVVSGTELGRLGFERVINGRTSSPHDELILTNTDVTHLLLKLWEQNKLPTHYGIQCMLNVRVL